MFDADGHYANAVDDVCSSYRALRPPRRMSVSEGAIDALVIKQPGGYIGPWSATETPYMVEPMDMLASRKHEAVCFVGPSRSGKCLDVTTPIPTPSGWSFMGNLKDGDVVFGPDGKPTKVLAAYEVKVGLPCYEVRFSDNSTLIADSEHLWGVERFYWREPNWRYEVRTTEQLISDIMFAGNRFRYRVRNSAPIDLPEADLPVDPYVLGVWLGNGSANQCTVSSNKGDASHYVDAFTSAGHNVVLSDDSANSVWLRVDLRERLTDSCQRGHIFSEVGQASNGACMQCLRDGYHRRKRGEKPPELPMFAGTLASRLRSIGVLGDKHIPSSYLRSSLQQRLALLQGLMDTDGSFDPHAGAVEFSTVIPALDRDFCELARSLGFKPKSVLKTTTWTYKGVKKSGVAFRITFPVGGNDLNPFRLPRKRDNMMRAVVDVGYRQIVEITPVPTRPVRCIQVDNDSHLFLAGYGFIPTHNTLGLLEGWAAHIINNDPGDMLITQMTQDKAREYSKTRIDRMLRHSPQLHALMSTNGYDDNTHDKMFRHGMWLKIGWPTVSQLSSSDYRYVALTDYDRMPNDVDGEGSAFALGLKRTTTFLSRGMCLVESSPGYDFIDPAWIPITKHEAPPTEGVIGIYNRSDRRRWYWKCFDCHEWFEAAPGVGLFNLPSEEELMTVVREADIDALSNDYARVVCPHCGSIIKKKHKHELNLKGRWLIDGLSIDKDDAVTGVPMTSSIAGYWLGGVAAAYQSWKSLVMRYMQGLREYSLNGSELTLKTTINTDQGMPYMPMNLRDANRSAMSPIERADKDLKRYICPQQTRFITAAIDVQGGKGARFIVQVQAHGVNFETWLIDRYEIRDSRREGMGAAYAPIDPASYAEDWDRITECVVRCTYRTTMDNLELRVKMVAVDTGGEDGVTDKAYAWYRRLRKEGLHKRVMLVKGNPTKAAYVIRETMQGKRHGREKGDVPVYLLNTNLLKDATYSALQRTSPGPGYYHFPLPKTPQNPDAWLPLSFFDELNAEVRGKDGSWSQIRSRNESFDLACYNRAACLRLGADKIRDWDNAPTWAQPLERNSELITKDDRIEMSDNTRIEQDAKFSQPAQLNPVRVRQRRAAPSRYLG